MPAKRGPSDIHSKSTIGAAYKRLPKDYLSQLNDILAESIEIKSVAKDSPPYSTTANRHG